MDTHQEGSVEYAKAFLSIRFAKNIAMFVVLLAILVLIASLILVRFGGVIDAAMTASAAPCACAKSPCSASQQNAAMNMGEKESIPAAQPVNRVLAAKTRPSQAAATTEPVQAEPTTKATSEEDSGDALCAAQRWYSLLHSVLLVAKTLTPIVMALAFLFMLIALKLSLVGRLGGAAGLTSAMLWALVLLALLTPWQDVFVGSFATGAMFDLHELTVYTGAVNPEWNGNAGALTRASYYIRFLVIPVLALIVWSLVMLKFRRGFRAMMLPEPYGQNETDIENEDEERSSSTPENTGYQTPE